MPVVTSQPRPSAGRGGAAPTYRLVRPPVEPAAEPVLDPAQQQVVEHGGGPLLVLAGPGTGKTTTLVEAVVARISAGADPEQVLVLTFGRRAAAELRARISARLGGATREPLARTFHSYAFGLLRREAVAGGEPAPRLLTGPEQDLVVRDLLAGDLARGAPGWPRRLHPALATQGFAQELRDLLLRARERGVEAAALHRLGVELGRDDWQAAAGFMAQYANVTALREAAAYDPAELVHAVLGLWVGEPGRLAAERAARPYVFVDELQDTDPAQVELLRLLAGDGRHLVAVGDPDQSIYGFRGADVEGIRGFRDTFRTAGGATAPVLWLGTSRRAGSVLLAASRRVAGRLGGPRHHRSLTAAPGLPPGEVEVAVLRSQAQEAAYVAARLRRAHLVDGLPWDRMAVLVRSTRSALAVLPVLRRAMVAAGVPVAVCGDEVPLRQEPAVRPLLRLLGCAARPETLDEDAAVELLTSPVGGADLLTLRRLRQALRRIEVDAGGDRPSGALLVAALLDAAVLVTLDSRLTRPAREVAGLLATAREVLAVPGATAEEVLWAVWERTGLAARWERASRAGGPAAAAADRDLDAVVALFDAAARFCDRLPGAAPDTFLAHLAAQQIPTTDGPQRPVAGAAVQVLTAHASKGLEWDLVAVVGVQEGGWPDLRVRGSFLGSERLVELLRPGAERTASPVASAATLGRLLAEERRLCYVAVTRARRWLLVTAVASEREGLTPSRFLDDLDPLEHASPRPLTELARPMSLPSLVAELRQTATDEATPADLRAAAAHRLAILAAAGARGADPASWWGLLPLSDDRPVRPGTEPVPLRPSQVEAFRRCQLRWFLEHVGGAAPAQAARRVGTLVHAVAETATTPATSTEAALQARLAAMLPGVDLGSGWLARRERGRAEQMVRRLAGWLAANSRELLAVEQEFEVAVGRARLTGRVDRVERDDLGRAVVVDVKTGTAKVPTDELPSHGQLAAYQLAAQAGAFPGGADSGGAELVQVGTGGGASYAVAAQPPLAAAADPAWARQLVLEVAEGMAGSAFLAAGNRYCGRCPVRTSCPVQPDGRAVTA